MPLHNPNKLILSVRLKIISVIIQVTPPVHAARLVVMRTLIALVFIENSADALNRK